MDQLFEAQSSTENVGANEGQKISIIPPECFFESPKSAGVELESAQSNMSQLRSTSFRPGMQLTEIVGCVNTTLDVIGRIHLKLAQVDDSGIVEELILEPLGNRDAKMECTSLTLEEDDFVSDIDVNYGNAYIGTLTARLKSGRKMTWGRRYYPLT